MPSDTPIHQPGAATESSIAHARTVDPTLHHDVICILQEATRDRRGDGIFQAAISSATIDNFAGWLPCRLVAKIGGRDVPARNSRDELWRRDAAVCQAFTGRNHQEVMRSFAISRRLLYSILARNRKVYAITARSKAALSA